MKVEVWSDVARPGNTFDAHRVVHLAREYGLQQEVKERLFRAVFSEGEPVGDGRTVARLAVEAGLPEDDVVDVLSGSRFGLEVREDEAEAMEMAITGVPFTLVDRRIALAGAQRPEVLLDALRRAAADGVTRGGTGRAGGGRAWSAAPQPQDARTGD